ncbi:serine hydrolase [Sediminitomix flava]|uniref:Beta-lactamase family protein n=1 Tax=Sediminitomix flava TaxID=379075 RepID=A0A315ZBQ2_SEDFL|nr:serine hydrolase [Sediminitomix flava]PWJ42144.1 beta-lactamase family protein [Sediminitomix flava]
MNKRLFFSILTIFSFLNTISFAQEENSEISIVEIPTYIKQHPERFALIVQQDKARLVDVGSYVEFPVLNLQNFPILIEYAYQIANGNFTPDYRISIRDLNVYQMNNISTKFWQDHLERSGKIQNNKIMLQDVAMGMMLFNVDACHEYLVELLGKGAIESRLKKLGLKDLDFYPYPSSQHFFQAQSVKNADGFEYYLNNLSEKDKASKSWEVHNALRDDFDNTYKENDLEVNPATFKKIAKIWVDQSRKEKVENYIKVLHQINSKSSFPNKVNKVISETLELEIMKSPEVSKDLKHCGFTTGSYLNTLVIGMYGEDLYGKQTEMILVVTGMNESEHIRLSKELNQFGLRIIRDRTYRKKLMESFPINR